MKLVRESVASILKPKSVAGVINSMDIDPVSESLTDVLKAKSESEIIDLIEKKNSLYGKILKYVMKHYEWKKAGEHLFSTDYYVFGFVFYPNTNKDLVLRVWGRYFDPKFNMLPQLFFANGRNTYFSNFEIKSFKGFLDLIKPYSNIVESLTNVFITKSEEEIIKGLEKEWPITDENDPTRFLRAGIHRDSIALVRYALKHGGEVLERQGNGNLWVAFNDGGNLETKQLIIKEMMMQAEIDEKFKTDSEFRYDVLKKSIYMGFMNLIEWLLITYEKFITRREVMDALYSAEDSGWKNNDEAGRKILDWLRTNVKESLGDVLKPKSENEVKNAMKNLSRDEWGEMVLKEIDRIGDEYGLDFYIEFRGDQAYADGVMPHTYAKQEVEKHFEDWKPQGGMTLTNTGGIELKINDSGDGVEYRYSGETIPRGAEIQYGYVYDEDQEDSFFEDNHGNKYELSNFMRY